jgi:hypothetical protein
MCGREFKDADYNDELSIHTTLGFGSKYDMSRLDIDFCSVCMDKIIDRCVIPPIKELVIGWEDEVDFDE